eukprot:TRINITY_DN4493_c0_g1_i2.p1 TRINITY_DN4493_c0_g1~~TRINITY_DN4493_c0_g1_i2.p1  ORF type:complete len:393 (+),score=149.69 TRINITY_DN4493_c0_g1_i2:80-1258(+)
MNSVLRSVQREARAGVTFAERKGPLSDSNVAHNLKNLINGAVMCTSDSKRRSKQAYQLTFKVLKYLQDEKDRGSRVGERAVTTAMWGLMKHGLPRAVPRLFRHAEASSLPVGVMGWNTLAGSFAAVGNVRKMWGTIGKMRESGVAPNIHTYNTCIGQCSRAGQPQECFALFKALVKDGLTPDSNSWMRLIAACGAVNQAHEVLNAMSRQRPPTYVHYNALLGVCMKCRDAPSAEFFFNTMLTTRDKDCRPNTITFTTLMSLYRAKDDFSSVVEVYSRMRKYAITPNAATYVVFLGACDEMASRDSSDTQRFVNVAVAAFKQALAEGLDELPLIATAARFLAKHQPGAMEEVRQYMEGLDIDVPTLYDDAWRESTTPRPPPPDVEAACAAHGI